MKKEYKTVAMQTVATEFLSDAMQVVASEYGIGYGGEDDGTHDPEAPVRPGGIENQGGYGNLW